MKIAIVGAGISGLVAAYRLHDRHDITVYETEDRPGGHTATVDVVVDGETQRVDTGFIVFNDWTYPGFISLMDELGVPSRQSDMSFSVSCQSTGLEYAGVDGNLAMINSLFAQRRRLLSPQYIGMLLDILRFNRQATHDVEADTIPQDTLQEYVRRHRYSDMFRDFYLVPMASAIWSTPFNDMLDFPMPFMLPFMYRHGLISVNRRPKWRTISGGSDSYITPMTSSFRDRIRLSTPVTGISRSDTGVMVHTAADSQEYEQVILACHSDQALSLLRDPAEVESQVLGAIRYQPNEVVLHTDASVLPRNRRAWASWNYRMSDDRSGLPRLSYDMNRLMGLTSRHQFCVTLNDSASIDPSCVLRRFTYAHPIFDSAAAAAQQRWHDINGQHRTWYCGAWWGKGFHEDGVSSALRVVDALADCRA